jgi:hypothetical protein
LQVRNIARHYRKYVLLLQRHTRARRCGEAVLRAYASSRHANGQVARADTNVTVYDTLFFNLPDGVLSAPITLRMNLDGTLVGFGFSNVSLSFGPNSTGIVQEPGAEVFNHDFAVTTVVEQGVGYQAHAWINFQALYDGSGFSEWNVLSTATASLILPEGVTFSSQSGVFLTQPVPLPAALWLLGSAIGFLGWVRRKAA